MKKPKTFIAVATFDSEYWKTKKDNEATIFKVKWFNGEHHYLGVWNDTKIEFMLPSIFFNDINR